MVCFSTTYTGLIVIFLSYIVITSAAPKTALLIIDVQNCFLPGGSLAVAGGEQIIPVVNSIRAKYGDKMAATVLSQDWHCPEHVSFAATHHGKEDFEEIDLKYDKSGKLCKEDSCVVARTVKQTLWPVHCVMNTEGAELSPELTKEPEDIIIKKGQSCEIDSYSAFYDNGGFQQTELHETLQSRGIQRVISIGFALDICVYSTCKDAIKLGYETYVVVDASARISNITAAQAIDDMKDRGIHMIESKDLGMLFDDPETKVQDEL